MESSLRELAARLRERNDLDERISELIGRPASPGHIGEFIAAAIFGIDLYPSATHKGADGTFHSGPLQRKTVNIKLYGKQEGLLDIREDALPDFFLVLTGPRSQPAASRGGTRPLTIDHVYLFEAMSVLSLLKARGVKLGPASSVPQAQWSSAEIWPVASNPVIRVDPSQAEALDLFRTKTGA